MSTSLAVDANNDLFIGTGGALAVVSGLASTLQACEHAARTLQGEMIYAVDQGIPYFAVAWNGSPNRVQFEAFLRRALLAVAGVSEVTALSSRAEGGTLSYSATIQTIYGVGAISG